MDYLIYSILITLASINYGILVTVYFPYSLSLSSKQTKIVATIIFIIVFILSYYVLDLGFKNSEYASQISAYVKQLKGGEKYVSNI